MWGANNFSILFFLLFIGNNAIAQTEISTNEILKKTLSKPSINFQNREIEFLENTNHELPWIDKMEVRTETDELDWERQEYLFRISMNSTEEKEAQNRIHANNIDLAAIEKDIILEEELSTQYDLIIKAYHLQKEITLQEKLKSINQDRLKIFNRKAQSAGTNEWNNIISTEERMHEIDFEITELKQELSSVKLKLGVQNDSIIIDDFTPIETIKTAIFNESSNPSKSPEEASRELEIKASQLEYELEKATSSKFLDFVQLKYSGRDNLNLGQEFSFGMAFNIPSKNGNKLDLNELALEEIENRNRLENYILERNEKIAELKLETEQLFSRQNLIREQYQNSQLKYSSENYPTTIDTDPLLILKIEELETKKQFQYLSIEEDIYSNYIELIYLSGNLISRPLRNYLSTDLTVFE